MNTSYIVFLIRANFSDTYHFKYIARILTRADY